MDWLRDDSFSRSLEPLKPFVLGLDDAETAALLSRAPPALRARLEAPGLAHTLLPAPLRAPLLGPLARPLAPLHVPADWGAQQLRVVLALRAARTVLALSGARAHSPAAPFVVDASVGLVRRVAGEWRRQVPEAWSPLVALVLVAWAVPRWRGVLRGSSAALGAYVALALWARQAVRSQEAAEQSQ